MDFVVFFVSISLWYVYKISYNQIPKQSIYAFILMFIYIIIYFSIPQMKEYTLVHRYTYIFIYFPLITYTMILFPRSILISTKEFFPKLSERLAIDATIIVAWVGFLLMFILLFGLKYFYETTL